MSVGADSLWSVRGVAASIKEVHVSNSITTTALHLRRLREASPAVAIARAELMPVLAAVLVERLTGPTRVVAASEFAAQLEADLDELRDHGFDLPRTAQEYLTEWVRQGILVRRPGEGRAETVELSAPAVVALRFLTDLVRPRSTVTSSRLATVSHLLSDLARLTDPDAERRLQQLRRQRDQLDAEIAQAELGRVPVLDAGTALERLAEIVSLTVQIPQDFAQVSASVDDLNRDLREQIITATGPRGHVLDDVFAGVDLIEQSDAGRTFDAFHTMLLDPDRTEQFDAAVSAVLERDVADTLSVEEQRLLRDLFTVLQRESRQVRGVMTGLSRSLRQFVETRAWLEHQRLADALSTAQATTLDVLRERNATTKVPWQLDSTGVTLASIGSWRLHNPDDVRTTEPVAAQPLAALDLAALREQVRTSEIDFAELQEAVAAALAVHGVVSIGEVLAEHPASQGLASVVGLIVLAQRFGVEGSDAERVGWVSASGRHREMELPRLLFTHVPEQWTRDRERAA